MAFAVNFRGMSMLKDRTVAIIIEFISVSYNLDALAEIQKVECDSRLDAGALVSTKCIQLLQRRVDEQQMAHLITRLKMPEDANWTIKNGLIMAGKGVWARRMRREPRRCLKCQVIGANHFTVGCCSQNSRVHRDQPCLVLLCSLQTHRSHIVELHVPQVHGGLQ